MISNAGVDLVAIYGMENPDWLLGSTDPKAARCQDLKDQAVGVDSVGGARPGALEQLIPACGLKIDQGEVGSLRPNLHAAMITRQITESARVTREVPVP